MSLVAFLCHLQMSPKIFPIAGIISGRVNLSGQIFLESFKREWKSILFTGLELSVKPIFCFECAIVTLRTSSRIEGLCDCI